MEALLLHMSLYAACRRRSSYSSTRPFRGQAVVAKIIILICCCCCCLLTSFTLITTTTTTTVEAAFTVIVPVTSTTSFLSQQSQQVRRRRRRSSTITNSHHQQSLLRRSRRSRPSPSSLTSFVAVRDDNENNNNNSRSKEQTATSAATVAAITPRIVFPGGGIYFYWQAGVASYLRENYDLSQVSFAGASAGALSATLTATNVDFVVATELALQLAQDGGVWDRSSGLQGIWGGMIEEWLDTLLPENAVEMVEGRLAVLVTPVPSFGKTRISSFASKQDLIQCNMASVHIPWFLDGKLTRNLRNKGAHIDGSFLSKPTDYFLGNDDNDDISSSSSDLLVLDYSQDPAIMSQGLLDFVDAKPKELIWNLIDDGRAYAETMENQGEFDCLSAWKF